jgi:hypothetical protein
MEKGRKTIFRLSFPVFNGRFSVCIQHTLLSGDPADVSGRLSFFPFIASPLGLTGTVFDLAPMSVVSADFP